MVTKIIFIRHAEAMGNVTGRYQGRSDADVTENGRKQLDALAERFKDIPFDVIYTSPLSRTRATAEAVNRYNKKEIIIEDGLLEFDGGKWEGKKWDDIAVEFPDELYDWNNHLEKLTAPDGESIAELRVRMAETVKKILKENKGKTIVAVSHGCALRTYFNYALNLPFEEINNDHWVMNTSLTLFEYDDDLKATMIYKEDATHLENAGVPVKKH